MDQEAERQQLESEKAQIHQYLEHPISRKVERDHEEQREGILNFILNVPVTDIESLVKHFEAIGHLRGLKRSKAITVEALGEIEEKLKEIKI